MKTTLRDVHRAKYMLRTIEMFKKEYEKYATAFKLRCNISNEIYEIPLNEIIRSEIRKHFEEETIKYQKIVDQNPNLVKKIENYL